MPKSRSNKDGIKELKSAIRREKARGLGGERENRSREAASKLNTGDRVNTQTVMSNSRTGQMSERGMRNRSQRMRATERLAAEPGAFQTEKPKSRTNLFSEKGKIKNKDDSTTIQKLVSGGERRKRKPPIIREDR